MIEGLEPIILAGLDDYAVVYDGDTGPDGTAPSVWINPGGMSITNRTIDGRGNVTHDRALIVCSANTAMGVSRLSRDVAMALDGARHADGVLRVTLITEAIEDRDDPTEYQWSSTVDVMLSTSRPR